MNGAMIASPGSWIARNSPRRVVTPTNPCWTRLTVLRKQVEREQHEQDRDDEGHDQGDEVAVHVAVSGVTDPTAGRTTRVVPRTAVTMTAAPLGMAW